MNIRQKLLAVSLRSSPRAATKTMKKPTSATPMTTAPLVWYVSSATTMRGMTTTTGEAARLPIPGRRSATGNSRHPGIVDVS